jgi:amidohydrolase
MEKATLHQLIKQYSNEIFDQVVEYRQHLHQNPELSFQEFETANYVSGILTKIGITHETGVAGTGVIALIRGDHHELNAPCIGLRADLDALPIQEENEVAYKSQNAGIMHACGHDVHTSILLGTAEVLYRLRNEIPHPVKLIFQPGEEKNPGGASLLIKAGVLENPTVKEMYALHVFPELETGKVGFKEGLYMASCDEIYITIHGKGGHGAMPHQCIDPILIGANIITSLQQIVSRQCDPKIPCVLSFGYFAGLGATNVIPSTVELKGTFRTMDEDWREKALILIQKQAELIAASLGGSVTVEISRGYPFLTNNIPLTQQLSLKAKGLLGENQVIELPIRLTAEDFSFYSQKIPVCFFRLGVRNETKGIIYGVHHPRFNIDSKSILTGIQMMSLAVF